MTQNQTMNLILRLMSMGAVSLLISSCGLLLFLGQGEISEEQKTRDSDWEVKNFIDKFGDQTNQRYLINKVRFTGRFSNSATTGSRLDAQIGVKSSHEVMIYLYEYGIFEMLSLSADTYHVKIKTPDNQELQGVAVCQKTCLLSEKFSLAVHKQLITGANIKFYIEEESQYTASSTYRFSTGEHEGYSHTFDQL